MAFQEKKSILKISNQWNCSARPSAQHLWHTKEQVVLQFENKEDLARVVPSTTYDIVIWKILLHHCSSNILEDVCPVKATLFVKELILTKLLGNWSGSEAKRKFEIHQSIVEKDVKN